MRYVMARWETEYQNITYRIFVTDYLKAIGRFDGDSYKNLLANLHKPIETRTSDEIVKDMKNKLKKYGES